MVKKLRKKLKWIRAVFGAKILRFGLIGFSLFALQACFTDVEIPLPDVPPKLVISSFISPEAEGVLVSVSKTIPLLTAGSGSPYTPVPDATVWLSDGTDSVQLVFDPNGVYVTTDLPILPGQKYTLRVTAPGGFAARASCTVPTKLNQSLTVRIDSSGAGSATERLYSAQFSWQDLPGEGDFYKADGGLVLEEPDFPGFPFEQPLDMYEAPYVRDYQADGRNWATVSGTIVNYRQDQQEGRLKALNGYLFTTDRAYYEYHNSLKRFQTTDNFLDPVKIYSNVEGGLGIFAAYRSYKVTLPLR